MTSILSYLFTVGIKTDKTKGFCSPSKLANFIRWLIWKQKFLKYAQNQDIIILFYHLWYIDPTNFSSKYLSKRCIKCRKMHIYRKQSKEKSNSRPSLTAQNIIMQNWQRKIVWLIEGHPYMISPIFRKRGIQKPRWLARIGGHSYVNYTT